MCQGMYSPKIREDLIPYIHRLSHHMGRPMTYVVNCILDTFIGELKEGRLFETIEAQERTIEEISDHILKLVRSKNREDRERITDLFKKLAQKEDRDVFHYNVEQLPGRVIRS